MTRYAGQRMLLGTCRRVCSTLEMLHFFTAKNLSNHAIELTVNNSHRATNTTMPKTLFSFLLFFLLFFFFFFSLLLFLFLYSFSYLIFFYFTLAHNVVNVNGLKITVVELTFVIVNSKHHRDLTLQFPQIFFFIIFF